MQQQNDLMQYYLGEQSLPGMINAPKPWANMPQTSGFESMGAYGASSPESMFPGYQAPARPDMGSIGSWQGGGAMQHNIWSMGDGAYMQNPFYGSSVANTGSSGTPTSQTGSVGSPASSGGFGGQQPQQNTGYNAASQAGMNFFNNRG